MGCMAKICNCQLASHIFTESDMYSGTLESPWFVFWAKLWSWMLRGDCRVFLHLPVSQKLSFKLIGLPHASVLRITVFNLRMSETYGTLMNTCRISVMRTSTKWLVRWEIPSTMVKQRSTLKPPHSSSTLSILFLPSKRFTQQYEWPLHSLGNALQIRYFDRVYFKNQNKDLV